MKNKTLNKKLDITKGAWKSLDADEPVSDFGHYIRVDKYGVLGYHKGGKSSHEDHYFVLKQDDSILMCDAANTYQKNGLLPSEMESQLQKMRDALIEALAEIPKKIGLGGHTNPTYKKLKEISDGTGI